MTPKNDPNAKWWRCDNPNLDLNWELIPTVLTDHAPHPYTRPSIKVGDTLKISEKLGALLHVVWEHKWRIPDAGLGDYLKYSFDTEDPRKLLSVQILTATPPPAVTGDWVEVTP